MTVFTHAVSPSLRNLRKFNLEQSYARAPLARFITRAVSTEVKRSARVSRPLSAGSKPRVEVSLGLDGTGAVSNHTHVPFLDHMLDQLGTHGLLDLAVSVQDCHEDTDSETINNAVGAAVGAAFAQLGINDTQVRAEFYSPLDESLQGVCIHLNGQPCLQFNTTIPTARVGRYETRLVESFYRNLVAEAGINVSIERLTLARNCNSHHIIEATFKAFSRAVRQAVDVVDGRAASADAFAGASERTSTIHRATGETTIDVTVTLDGLGRSQGTTTIPLLDVQLEHMAAASGISMNVNAVGDTHIDDHHTVEDTAIVIGKALQTALGDRSGINRMGFASETVGSSTVHATLDLSGRPHLGFDIEFPDERVETFDTQLVEHTYQSLVNQSGLTLHIRRIEGNNSKDLILATAKAVGKALRMGIEYDERRAGKIASSKGVL